ncbi:hypothetical protein [Plantactinospora sp. GCM10030261]|uniref:hypothetical protein n=1 Tax=Plantactinospora sp. GCM10030261 TaxID=3273420 RepID=UPI003620B881
MSMTCRACGRVNANGAQFCANPDCGAYLPWDGDPSGRPGSGGPYTGRVPMPGGAHGGSGPPSPGGPIPPAGGYGGQPPPGGAGGYGGPPPGGGDQRGAVRATLADPVVEVTPGSTGSTTLSVYNAGTQVDGFLIRLSGPAAAWSTVEPSELSVYPEQTGTVTLRFAPPRSSACPAGHAWYVVRLDSTVHANLTVTANGAAAVAAFHDLAAELVPPSSSGRGATKHQVIVDNRGNVVERARVSAADDEGAFRMELGRTAVELPPGRTAVPMTVRVPRRWFGRPRPVPIHATVAVEGSSAPLRADGTRHVVPVFPHWAPAAALATVLLLGGGGAAFALANGDDEPSDPVIGSPTSAAVPTVPPTAGAPTGPPTSMPPSGGASASATAKPSRKPSATPTAADPLDKIEPADCVPYDPAKLKIYDAGTIGWRLVETLPGGQEHRMLILDDQADAAVALAVARRSTQLCFVGRDNTRPNRADYIVQYWKGRSGQQPEIPSPDCIPYDKGGLTIVDEGASGWLLTDGSSRMLILDNEEDAKDALILAKAHGRQCFIGRDNTRPNRRDYIVGFWLP